MFCAICTELFTPSAEVVTNDCGHMFHDSCLTRWLERSPTCPQCRSWCSTESVHKVFPNFTEQSVITNIATKLETFQRSLGGVEKYIGELKTTYETKIQRLEAQLLSLQTRAVESNLRYLERKEMVIHGSTSNAIEILENERNLDTLSLLSVSLRRELDDNRSKAKLLHNVLKYSSKLLEKKDYTKLKLMKAEIRKILAANNNWGPLKDEFEEFLGRMGLLSGNNINRRSYASVVRSQPMAINNTSSSSSGSDEERESSSISRRMPANLSYAQVVQNRSNTEENDVERRRTISKETKSSRRYNFFLEIMLIFSFLLLVAIHYKSYSKYTS